MREFTKALNPLTLVVNLAISAKNYPTANCRRADNTKMEEHRDWVVGYGVEK
jgi:hypothetical protein